MGDERFDSLFMNVASQAGGIEGLLTTFFSFLNRRTDFYCVTNNPKATMGFRPNAAEKLLLHCFNKFPSKNIDPVAPNPKQTGTATKPNQTGTATKPPAKAKSKPKKKALQAAAAPPTAAKDKGKDDETMKIKYNEDGNQIPIGNGGCKPGCYYWTQSLYELSIYFSIPAQIKSKQIKCDIKTNQLSLKYIDSNNAEITLMDGKFPNSECVKADESFWSLDASEGLLIISLDKKRETWWSSVVAGDPQIDTSLVDSTRKVDEYDDATQAQIRKIMFDQRQQRLGLPSSEEITKNDIMDKAKYLPGSPFLPKSLGGSGDESCPVPPEIRERLS